MSAGIVVRPMRGDDGPRVLAIFDQGIAAGDATFERTAPTWADWDRSHLGPCRLVAEDARGAVAGWAALSGVSDRPVYRGVAEVSVYVADDARGQGVGHALMAALVAASEAAGLWTLQAGIFPENAASLALHRAHGFVIVGRHRRLGCQGTRWRDVMLLERRSERVGI